MRCSRDLLLLVLILCVLVPARGDVAMKILRADVEGQTLLRDEGWRFYEKGFTREGQTFVCDNGTSADVHRGVAQTVVLNQSEPHPIVARAWSKAEGVKRGGPPSPRALEPPVNEGAQASGAKRCVPAPPPSRTPRGARLAEMSSEG